MSISQPEPPVGPGSAPPPVAAPGASSAPTSGPGSEPFPRAGTGTTTPLDLPRWRRPPPSRSELRNDVLLGLAMAVAGVCGTELAVGVSATEADMGFGGVEGYLLSAAVALPLCLRRRYPLTVLCAVALIFFVAGERVPLAFGANIVTQATLFMAIYTATAWADDRRRLKVTMVVVTVGMFGWLFYGFVQALRNDTIQGLGQGVLSPYVSFVVLNIGINIVYFVGAYLWGRTAWRTARQRSELERQAVELAEQQQANARRAVIDERLRISRELHDVVAHHISSIGVQAGGARRVLDTDPAATKAALSVIEESSRTAVNEMRQLLGMLRAADPDLDEEPSRSAVKAPQAGADRLPALVATVNSEQLSVGFHQIGVPVKLPETISVSVYRIAQEALTNVRRHSTARTAHITLRYLGDAIEIEVIDDGRPKHAPVGSRLGHVGIRERVALLGGESEIGPRTVGGFRVRARIPLTGSPAEPQQAPNGDPAAHPVALPADELPEPAQPLPGMPEQPTTTATPKELAVTETRRHE